MTAKKIAMLAGTLVLVSSGIYVFVYLYRWEWNRALFVGMLFIATEVALATALVLERVRNLTDAVHRAPPPDKATLERLRQSRPSPRDHFAWLSPTGDRMGVFVPILMGAGVVLSALAWVVERIARRTATPVLETRLARRLAPLALPAGGLVADDCDIVRRWFEPGGRTP